MNESLKSIARQFIGYIFRRRTLSALFVKGGVIGLGSISIPTLLIQVLLVRLNLIDGDPWWIAPATFAVFSAMIIAAVPIHFLEKSRATGPDSNGSGPIEALIDDLQSASKDSQFADSIVVRLTLNVCSKRDWRHLEFVKSDGPTKGYNRDSLLGSVVDADRSVYASIHEPPSTVKDRFAIRGMAAYITVLCKMLQGESDVSAQFVGAVRNAILLESGSEFTLSNEHAFDVLKTAQNQGVQYVEELLSEIYLSSE